MLAAALARRTGMIVFATEDRADKLALTRETARASGLLGTRFFADEGSPSRIPLSNDYADLVIMAELEDGALATVPLDEIKRVLAPKIGRALIGRGAWAGGDKKLTRTALEAWANKAEGVSVREDADGLWAVVEKPAKNGADNWSYWNHGADNNPASLDTAYGGPESIQWIGRPFQTGMSVLYLSAGGRVFLAYSGDRFSGNVGWPRYGPEDAIETKERQIHALEGYNGRLLWSRKLPSTPWFSYHAFAYSIWVATDEAFYYGETEDIVTLDARSGVETGRIKATDKGQTIYWLAVENCTAYVLTGEGKKGGVYSGQRLAAYKLATQERLWEHLEPTAIDAHAVAMSGGRVNFFAGEKRAAALDAATGREVWSNEKLDQPAAKAVKWSPVTSRMICFDDRVAILNVTRGLIVLSGKDGSELWRKERGLSRAFGNGAMAETGEVLLTNLIPKLASMKSETGEKVAGMFGFSGCGRLICTPRYAIGQLGNVVDMEEKKPVARQYMKPACAVGNIVANGLRYSAPHWCRCLNPFRGLLAWGRGPEAAKPAFPLEAGAPAQPAALDATAEDWTQYRRDGAHTGASPVSVGSTAPVEQWRFAPPTASLPTPVISVGGSIFAGGEDGIVRGIDAKTGKGLWEFPTAGKVYFPPTYSDGRVYVGSSDGRVYCLAADTGMAQWRFRAAPEDRRMLVYDRLTSRWPVNSNLVVDNGTVFACAGLVDTEGVYVHALDARTGNVKWTNDALGKSGHGMVPMGAMAMANGRLWLRTDRGHPSFDPETGALAKLPADGGDSADDGPDEPAPKAEDKNVPANLTPEPPSRERTGMGKDMGFFAGKYLIDGGRRLYSEQCDRVQSRCDAFAQALDASGTALYPRYMLARRGAPMFLMPAWDDELLVSTLGHKLSAVLVKEQLRCLDATRAMDKGVRAVLQAPPAARWTVASPHLNALALAQDAVLILQGVAKEISPGLSSQKTVMTSWRLAALNREDGKELWSLTVPSEPVFDGLTIDRNGRILVALANGTIVCYGQK
ncbi:MAG: hypothetical protein AMXMBFR7_36370 [Planctomycetota bacterium]